MRERTGTTAGRLVLICALALAFVMTLSVSAYAATPTDPVLKDVFPSGSNQVTLKWLTSTDASATHTISYEIYRSKVPITQSMITPSLSSLVTLVSTVSLTSAEPTWTAVVNADVAGGEVADSYVWFYIVRAKDDQTTPAYSGVSYTMSPNMHGYRSSANLYSCQRCHNVHGAPTPPGIVDRSSWICYYCHGRADNNAASTIGDRSTLHTKSDFYDYAGQTFGSQHRSAKMSASGDNQQCRACHSPHRAPYFFSSPDGTTVAYDPLQSFRMALRVRTGGTDATPTYTYYSRNDVTAENTSYCYACHGSTTASPGDGAADTVMGYVSTGGYAATAGDHNEANYATAAHGTGVIYSNDYGKTRQNDFPQVQCLACHDKHASAADKLIAYRSQDTTTTGTTGTYTQAQLCYACHSSNYTNETKTTSANVNFAWNSRDVKTQFTKTGSTHPTIINTGTTPTRVTHDNLVHTTQTQFQAYAHSQTSATLVPDAITLAQTTAVVDLPAEPWIFANRGAATTFAGFDLNSQKWNDGYTPANHDGTGGNSNFSPASGSSSFWVEANKRFYTTLGGTVTQYQFDPASGTTGLWSVGQNLPTGNIGIGGDTAVNSGTGHNWVYYTQAGGSSAIKWWNYTSTATGTFNFYYNNATVALAQGSAIAYAPDCDRLYVLNKNNGTGDGRLYYRVHPDNDTTNENFTQCIDVDGTYTTTYQNRMTYFKKGGAEYLMIIGRDSTGRFTRVISSIGGTPVELVRFADPFGGVSLADGADLEWDGGDYIYAVRGGANQGFRRIRIPDAPQVAGNWNSATYNSQWSAELANPPWDPTGGTWGTASSIAVGKYDPPATNMTVYYTTGNATSTDFTATTPADQWGTVSWNAAQNTGAFTVEVQGYSGGSWVQLATGSVSPINISTRTVANYPKVRLIGSFASSADRLSSPVLYDWTVTTTKEVQLRSRSATCVNCHNVHGVAKGAGAWDTVRVSDPANTKNPVSAASPTSNTAVNFCLGCHGAALPTTAGNNATTLVPYNATFQEFAPGTAPYFPSWSKSVTGLEFANSGHFTVTAANGQATCATCHDPHASDFKRLTAWTMPTGSGLNAGTRENATAALTQEENLCYQCHGNGTTTLAVGVTSQRAAGAKDVITKATMAYAHKPAATTLQHLDTELPGVFAANSTSRHAECTDCHDPHATKKNVSGSALHAANPTANSSAPGSAVLGAYGAAPTYSGVRSSVSNTQFDWNFTAPSAYNPVRLSGAGTDMEAFLCFKCHSGNIGVTMPTNQTNLAVDFNPSNQSVHNVQGQSVGMQNAFTIPQGGTSYTWTLPSSTFLVTGWTTNSKMTCTDCHTNNQNSTTQAAGPHGASTQWLVDPTYTQDYTTATWSTYTSTICAKCHVSTLGSTGLHNATGSHNGTSVRCTQCHIAIPHGWKRPRMIVYKSDPAPYAYDPSMTALALTNYAGTWDSGNAQCAASNASSGGSCGTQHRFTGTAWP